MKNNFIEKLKFALLKNLHSSVIITHETFLLDEKGRKYNKHFKISESLTGNFLQLLYVNFCNGDTVNFQVSSFNGGNNTNVLGIANTQVSGNGSARISAATAIYNYGIVFGSGTNAATPQDYKLQTIITQGNGAGQLNFQAQTSIQAPIAVGANTSFVLQRIATNNSGAPVTVTEQGIYVQINSSASQTICIYRDLDTQIVPTTQGLQCNITWQVTT